jgi:hypothetical protein
MYGALVFMRFENLSWDKALDSYLQMAGLMGLSVTEDAAKKVHAAPKDKFGEVANVTPLGLEFEHETPNGTPLDKGMMLVLGSDPPDVIVAMLGCCDARRYLLTQIAGKSDGVPSNIREDGRYQWKYADLAYKRWVEAFGEADVLKAAETVRTSTKTAKSGSVINPPSIGALRGDPYDAFQDILVRNSPRGYVRAVLAFNENIDTTGGLDAAYQKLTSAYGGEAAVLDKAAKMASRSGTYSSAYPLVTFPSEMKYLMGVLDGSVQLPTPKAPKVPTRSAPTPTAGPTSAPMPCSPSTAAPRGKGSAIHPNAESAACGQQPLASGPSNSGDIQQPSPTGKTTELQNPPPVVDSVPSINQVKKDPIESPNPVTGQQSLRIALRVTTVDEISLAAVNEGRDIHATVLSALPSTVIPVGTDLYLKAAIKPQIAHSNGNVIWVSLTADYAVLGGKHVTLTSQAETVFLAAGRALRPGMPTVGGASVIPPNKALLLAVYVVGK